jgi:hypothetical protein
MQRALLLLVVVAFIPRAAAAQGEPVGPEFRVNTYTPDSQSDPSIAADASGNFVVVWESNFQDGSYDGVFGQRFASFGRRNTTSGAPVGPGFRVNTFTRQEQVRPAVASDASGNLVVVWYNHGFLGGSDSQDVSDHIHGIFSQRYASTGEPLGSEFRVNTHPGDFYQYLVSPSVAADSAGNFVVVWSTVGGDHYPKPGDVFGQRFASTGAPVGPEFRVNTYTTDSQGGPEVAADSSGNFVVVWYSDQDGSDRGIFGQRYASTGEPLGPEFRVNTYTTDRQIDPAVASDSSGNFVVVWESDPQDGSEYGVFGQRYASTGAPLGPEFAINTYTTDSQYDPAVASDASGNIIVVWQSRHQEGLGGDLFGVFGQRYARTGAALGPEFRVNTYLIDWRPEPSVAADASGRFVVVWMSDTHGASAFDVFGQRFSRIAPGPSWREPTDPVEE